MLYDIVISLENIHISEGVLPSSRLIEKYSNIENHLNEKFHII